MLQSRLTTVGMAREGTARSPTALSPPVGQGELPSTPLHRAAPQQSFYSGSFPLTTLGEAV